jgi:hypothetical protein
VRFQVLTAAGMKMMAFWAIAPCNIVEVYRRFRGAYCFYHQGYESLYDRKLSSADFLFVG